MIRNHYSYSLPKAYGSVTLPQKFPEDIQCIIHSPDPAKGSLYISNIEAAENLSTLKKLRIRAILTCAKGYQLKHPPSEIPDYKYIPTVDHDGCNISVHFDEAVQFIKQQLAQTNLLVHCIAGVSRSVTMVLAYLISEQNINYDEAYRLVKSRRKIICPNDGFVKQLKEYHSKQQSAQRNKSSPKAVVRREEDFSLSAVTPRNKNSYLEEPFRKYESTYLTARNDDRLQPTTPLRTSHDYRDSIAEKYEKEREAKQLMGTTAASSFGEENREVSSRRKGKYEYLEDYGDQRHTPISEKVIKVNLTPNQEEFKGFTPKKHMLRGNEKTVQSESKGRKGYFQNMNKELSDKIDSIRQKYDGERKKILQKYKVGDKKLGKGTDRAESGSKKQARTISPGREKADLGREYQDVKEYFQQSRASYADIYDKYARGQRLGGDQGSQKGSYLDYNYEWEKRSQGLLGRYRPHSQYMDRTYTNYFNYPTTYRQF